MNNLIQLPTLPPIALELTTAARQARETALEAAALVGRVSTPDENEKAVEAQKAVHTTSASFEKARVEVTKPLLAAQRAIKARMDKEREELNAEDARLAALIGDFMTLEDEKRRAAENAMKEHLSDQEQEREAAIAQAKTPEEVESIREAYAMTAGTVPEPTRAPGQVVRFDYKIDSINEWALLKARPDLVRKIEFDMRAIKDALKEGQTLPGVKGTRVAQASVRATPEREAITI